MNATCLPPHTLEFLQALAQNNNRDWFAQNKAVYLEALAPMEAFAQTMLDNLQGHDVIETASGKKSLYRIYRDIRFSKDKTPFSTYWGGRFRRAGKQRRGGYYYHFEPGNKSFVLCGFWGPSPQDLKRIREDIAFDPSALQSILANPVFAREFGGLQGEQLKTTPKGFDAGHEAIQLLRHKQFLVYRRFTDIEVYSPGFHQQADQAFRNMRPFLDYMSEVLCTDANGNWLGDE